MICKAVQRREIYFVLLYYILDGLLKPTFGDFTYFFLLDVVGLSKVVFVVLVLISSVCSIFGVMLYEKFLKREEIRWLFYWNVIILGFSAAFDYILARRWNVDWGIDDIVWIFVTAIIFGTLITAFGGVPTMTLFVQITPRRIEGTIFAVLTGVANLDNDVLSPMMGAYVNN